MTQSNGALSTNEIVSHFVSDFASQNDKVHFDYVVTLDMAKTTCLDWQGGFFCTYHFWVFFKLENLIKKTMNCNSAKIRKVKFTATRKIWQNKNHIILLFQNIKKFLVEENFTWTFSIFIMHPPIFLWTIVVVLFFPFWVHPVVPLMSFCLLKRLHVV